ncbi:hypothetical protein WJX77_000033 [Trebouxia sp. C0004]
MHALVSERFGSSTLTVTTWAVKFAPFEAMLEVKCQSDANNSSTPYDMATHVVKFDTAATCSHIWPPFNCITLRRFS